MSKPHTPLRSIRVSDTLWSAASAVAVERDETLSEVIRAALREYVNTHGK